MSNSSIYLESVSSLVNYKSKLQIYAIGALILSLIYEMCHCKLYFFTAVYRFHYKKIRSGRSIL